RFAEQETLHFVTAGKNQELQLFRRFHPFGNHAHAEVVRHGNNGAGNLRVVGVAGQVLNKAAVNFQGVYRELLQIVERRVAGTDIINGRTLAEAAQAAEHVQGVFNIVNQNAFGLLQFQLVGTDTGPLNGVAHHVEEI